MTNKEKTISQWLFVFVVQCHALKYLSQDGIFQRSMGSTKKKNCCQSCWQPLVNTCLISEFQENVNSFNFLANALQCTLCAYVVISQCVLHAYMLTCQCTLHDYMLTCQHALHAHMLPACVPTCFVCLRAYVPTCLACFFWGTFSSNFSCEIKLF